MPPVKKIDEYQYDTSFMDALYSEEQNNSAAAAAPLPTPVVKEKLEVETAKKRTKISIADYGKRKNGGVAAQSQSLATSEYHRDPRKRVGEGSIYWGLHIQNTPEKKSEPKAAKPLENRFSSFWQEPGFDEDNLTELQKKMKISMQKITRKLPSLALTVKIFSKIESVLEDIENDSTQQTGSGRSDS